MNLGDFSFIHDTVNFCVRRRFFLENFKRQMTLQTFVKPDNLTLLLEKGKGKGGGARSGAEAGNSFMKNSALDEIGGSAASGGLAAATAARISGMNDE